MELDGSMDAASIRLETGRLVLRPLCIDDVDDFVELHKNPEVTRFIQPLDRITAVTRLEANEEEWRRRGHGMFAVILKVDYRFVGRCGLKYWEQFDEVEIGWVLHRTAWGHGYATEAANEVLQWGFQMLNIPYITAMIRPDNHRSIAVARRLGMARLRDDSLFDCPVIVFALERRATAVRVER